MEPIITSSDHIYDEGGIEIGFPVQFGGRFNSEDPVLLGGCVCVKSLQGSLCCDSHFYEGLCWSLMGIRNMVWDLLAALVGLVCLMLSPLVDTIS